MAKPIVKKINSREYEFYYLPVKDAHRILLTLVKMLGPSLGNTISGFKSMDDEIGTLQTIGNALKGFTERLNEQELDEIMEAILPYVKIKEKEGFVDILIETHFTGRLKDLYQVIYCSLEVNFADFLDDIKKVFRKTAKPKAVESQTV